MNRGQRLALLLPAAVLIGCTVPSATSTSPAGAWQNWQIQAGTAITSPPTELYFTGAVQTQGTQSTAVFTTGGLAGTGPVTVSSFLGTYNSSTGAVELQPATTTSAAYAISYTAPSTNAVIPVNVTGGCVAPFGGGAVCNAIFSVPSVGVEIASLTGTYTGTLTDSSAPTLSGPATLVLTQTTTPNSSGQFPLSGTITFPAGSTFGTAPLGGTVSGEGITLSDSSAAPNSPTVNVSASASPDGSQITVTNLLYSNFGPGAVFIYTGTLTRQ